MEWLNYHHLLYFWTVAKEGSLARAAEKLHVSPPSISEQMRELEAALGENYSSGKAARTSSPTPARWSWAIPRRFSPWAEKC